MTMGSIVAFSLVKSFEQMDEQLRQKQKEIETKKREEKVDLLMKTKERKVETRVEVVDAPLEVSYGDVVDAASRRTGENDERENKSPRAVSFPKLANENETALFEARKKREQILNEMAQYNDAPATTKNGNTMRPGKLAETTNNKYFANRATKRTADVLGYSTTPPKTFQRMHKKNNNQKRRRRHRHHLHREKETRRRYENQIAAFFAVCLSVYAFARTLQSVRKS